MSPPEKPLVLIGMMGAGKSTIGRLLAKVLGRDFSDCDRQVEIRAEKPIAEIFEQEREGGFRALESQVMAELLSQENTVIAAGGGAFLDKDLRTSVLDNAISIWLKDTPEEMFERAIGGGSRPLLKADNPRQVFLDLYNARKETYTLADITIECEGASPGEVVELICIALKGMG
ncbi:MAG: shikimate kinase [Alphaproteobacteria bacterium]|nr:MAG: shikimate kinase [Alphaproteobacteria bacterium]